MKNLYYFIAAVLGLLGILAVLRTIERLVSGAGVWPMQLLIAIVALVLAFAFLKQATIRNDIKTQIRPLMLAYTFGFGVFSVQLVYDDVKLWYNIIYVIWNAVFYVFVFSGNLIYSLGLKNPNIRKIWKVVFPIVILGYIFSDIVEWNYGPDERDVGVVLVQRE